MVRAPCGVAANCLICCVLLCVPLVSFHQGSFRYRADIQRVSRHGAREALQEELPVGIGLAGEGERVGAGGGGHSPEADGAGADVGVDEATDGRDSEGFLHALRLVEMTGGVGQVGRARGGREPIG